MSSDNKNEEQCESRRQTPRTSFTSLTRTDLDPLAFSIQPHPAKDNQPGQNPSGLQDDPEQSGGLRASNPNAMAGAGPVILDNETANSLEQPKSREEVRQRRDLGSDPYRTSLLIRDSSYLDSSRRQHSFSTSRSAKQATQDAS